MINMMKQGPFSREGRRPLLFLRPFSGKQVPERSDYGKRYFYAATEQEVRATIAHLTRRIGGIAAAIHGLNRSLERFDTEQTRLPLDGGDAP